MQNISASDWISGWTGATGQELKGAISLSAAWRSVYTKVTLEAESEYTLTFKFGQTRVGDVRVYPASEITDVNSQLVSSGASPTKGGNTNLASASITCSITSGTPVDGEFYEASETFTTLAENEYYIILDCYQCADSRNCVLLKDLSITKKAVDPNVLNDDYMKTLTWKALWGSSTQNPKTGEPDKSESYSGESYVMTWGRASRYRDNYTVITLKPNTTYNFSFRYKAKAEEEIVSKIGFVPESKTDFSTINGNLVSAHLTDSSTQILGQAGAIIEKQPNGVWNLVSTTFTTGSDTRYVMYLLVDKWVDGSFDTLTLSDFNLEVEPDSFSDIGLWGSTGGASITKSSDSCNGGLAVAVSGSNWRDTFVKVNLKANTYYKFNFNYKGYGGLSRVKIFAANDIDITQKVSTTERLEWLLKTDATQLLEKNVAPTCDNATWNNLSVEFKTNENTEYYIVLYNNGAQGPNNESNFVVSDLELVQNNAGVFSNTANWDSTSSSAVITSSSDSCNGGSAIAVSASFWRDTFAKVTLNANTKYSLSFKYKGYGTLYKVTVFAVNDIDSAKLQTIERVESALKNGAEAVYTTVVSPTCDNATWNDISINFTTNENTDYYIVLYNNAGTSVNGSTKTNFVVSDFSLVDEVPAVSYDDLTDTVATDWTSSWLSRVGTYEKVIAVQNAWRSAYTKITLEPYYNYNFTFNASTVKVSKVRVYAASEITDPETQLKSKGSAPIAGGNNNLVTSFGTTAPQVDFSEATAEVVNKYYNVSASFATGEETEYYIVVDSTQYLDNGAENPLRTFTHLKNLSLVAGEKVYVDPNKLLNATVANGNVRWSVGEDTEEDYITGVAGTEDENVTYTNSNGEETTINRVYYYDSLTTGTYNGGYAWRIIISHEEAMAVYNPAVYGYITAKDLEANTTYTFSYIYTDTYHVKIGDVYNASGSVAVSDLTTKILPNKTSQELHSYIVTANFTTDEAGDYTIKLQTGRSNKYYIYDSSSWAMTVSDLSLVPYEEIPGEEIPDDANLMEDLSVYDWQYTWSKEGDAYKINVLNNTLQFNGIQYHSVYTRIDNLSPNTEYILNFKYKSASAIDEIGIVPSANVNPVKIDSLLSSAIVSGKGSLVYYVNNAKVIDNTTLNDVTVKFVTNDETSYYLYFEGNSAANTSAPSGAVTISDMRLTKDLNTDNGIVVDYDFEDGSIGAISTTSVKDTLTILEENGNKYLEFARTNDGVTVPFWYNGNNRYVVSFDMKILSYPTSGSLEMHFKTCADNNNLQYSQGNIFTYRNDAYSLVTKDQNGKMLTAPSGLNYTENSQFNGFKQTFDNYSGWKRYEITIDPDYTYYTGLANFGFNADVAGWSIALDNIKVTSLDSEYEKLAENKFEPAKYAAIRQKTVDKRQGIRVKSSIDTTLLSGDVKVVEYGTLAINSNKLGDKELVYDMVNSDDYDVKKGVAYSADDGTNVIYGQDGTIVIYTGVLIGLKNYTTNYSVRGYLIAETADGERFVIYEEATKKVSVYDVVYAIINDNVTNEDDTAANEIVVQNQSAYNAWVAENYPADTALNPSSTVNATVYNAKDPLIKNYRGLSGTVYHAYGFMEDDATGRVYDADMLNTELNRLQDAGVHFVRTRYNSEWVFDDVTGYDWNSNRFNYFCNYAKALQEKDIEVILQVGWHFDFISKDGSATIVDNDYFDGSGDDLYGESVGLDFTGKTDDEIRIMKAAARYAYMMAKTIQYAKAKGINNIKYLSYFVEPSNTYSKEDGQVILQAGHDKEQYLLFCRTMRDALEENHGVTGIKHMGPNEAGYSKLIDYIIKNDPGLFDILSAHNYPEEGDVKTNYKEYYNTMTNNTNYGLTGIINGQMTDFSDYKGFLDSAIAGSNNSNIEFWSDEFNIKDFDAYEGRGTSSFYRGLTTAMGGIVAQQKGIQNIVLWMSFDQLWTDNTGGKPEDESEFMNGIHQCGNAPSLFLSDDPYAQYYPTALFSKYNGYEGGWAYETNLSTTADSGVYVGAVKLKDGSWTVTVVNMNTTATKVNISFDSAINQTLYRHIVSDDKSGTYKDGILPDVDKTFEMVGTSFSDVLPAGSFAVYTGINK